MLSVVAESILQTVIKHFYAKYIGNFIDPLIEKLSALTVDVLRETTGKYKYQWRSAVDEVYFAEIYKKLRYCDWQLEAHALRTNFEVLNFDVRSRQIDWKRLTVPLQVRRKQACRILGPNFNYMNEPIKVTAGAADRPEVLVCHDMMGNYLEDKHYRTSKKWDDYRFYHWQAIDYFNYFSHQYVTIPPCGWINAAHSHGVKILGTYITEGPSGATKLLYILESKERIEEFCDALVRLCEHFCFDGWLVNIECPVPTDKTSNLVYFVDTLRLFVSKRLRNGAVLWYDSVLHNGTLNWQNEVNSNNNRYFNVADGMLINYAWNDISLNRSKQFIYQERRSLTNAFFGIDVFGRGQLAKFRCRETLSRIARNEFSVGIFAPGWTFETLEAYGFDIKSRDGLYNVNEAFLQRNEKFWWLLWEYFTTHPFTEQPFFTDFCLGSGEHTYNQGAIVHGPFFNLNRQSLQPSVPLYECAERCYDDAVFGGCCLRITKPDVVLRLFVTDFRVRRNLIFAYAYKVRELDGDLECVLRVTDYSDKLAYVYCGNYSNSQGMHKGKCFVAPLSSSFHEALIDYMESSNAAVKIPLRLQNNWKVRYYGMTFENEVQVKDIGVIFKKATSYGASGFLGAVYFNSCDAIPFEFDGPSNWASISNKKVMKD